ncbi:uncharacterized protein ACA1_249900 [Acanthamoeba castellanii str. Neff]|uniref:CLU central domain-containing protein n=1 Tax=Acanthamoeba castellanii (strain ATCC 30010 / Neff) TaxID=1257118 RepID=L8HFE6_ACACF|nr:uncharacterized protein ACA1_249900 [Acanthamoeba castellanii str. Neff]ELR23126.1 hypothetical protein ACA1_249900 [Acanthamoeba castellanii str. Neff]
MVREKVNRIKEKAAAQKAERARKKEEEEVVVSCYVGMPSVPDDNESEDSAGDEDEEDEESGQKLSAKGNEHKRKDEEEEAELDGRYAADDAVADIYSSTVDTPASSYGPSPYESFNRGAGEGQSVYYADAVDEELARDEHEVNAFTIWAKADLHKDQYNTDVTEATKRLIKQVIPAVAEKMNNLVKNQSRAEEDLIEIIHSAGVNIRHLGYLRRRVNEKHQRDILIEMIARVVRKEVEKLLREKTRSSGIPSEEPHRVAVVGYLNKLLGRDSKSKAFWRHMKRTLQDKFAINKEKEKLEEVERAINDKNEIKRLKQELRSREKEVTALSEQMASKEAQWRAKAEQYEVEIKSLSRTIENFGRTKW